MAKTLVKIILLGALSAGASSLPNMLGGLPAVSGGKISGLSAPAEDGDIPTGMGNQLASLHSAVTDLKAISNAPHETGEGLSGEEREMIQVAAPKLKFRSNTLTRGVGLAPGGGAFPGNAGRIMNTLKTRAPTKFQSFTGFRGDLLNFYECHQAAMAYALWLVPAVAVILSFLLFIGRLYTVSMLLSSVLFGLSSALIWALSAAVGLSTILTKQSLLVALPRELWLSPVIFLVVSAGLLRLADENYPFWNKTVTTLLTPIAVSCVSAGWLGGAGFYKGLLGSAASFKT